MSLGMKLTPLADRQEALEAVKNARSVFTGGIMYWLAVVVAVKLSYMYFLVAILSFVVVYFLIKLKSRIAAILLLVFTLAGLILLIKYRNIPHISKMMTVGIILAIAYLFQGARAVEATFKLHGKFKEEPATNKGTSGAAS